MDFGYDYDSVMHYDMYAGSKNGLPTMVPRLSTANIGNKVFLSDQDAREIVAAYSSGNRFEMNIIINTFLVLFAFFLSFKGGFFY